MTKVVVFVIVSIDKINKNCQIPLMQDEHPLAVPADSKQGAILTAAFEIFGLYGFRRTSMEDIARGAGMSRAALYLHYKNKNDIYRSLVQSYYDLAVQGVRQAFAQDLTPTAALRAAFAAQTGPVFEAMLASPHGRELMDTKHAISADIAQAGEAEIHAVYTTWLQEMAAQGRVSLQGYGTAEAVALTMLRAFVGVKESLFDEGECGPHFDRLAALLGRALAPEGGGIC